MSYNGIDVSSYQGSIDWAKIAKQDVDFVIARASLGRRSRDTRFKANVAGAQAARLQVGAYHYSYAASVDQAHAEAENLLTAVKGLQITYPLVLDYEYNDSTAKAVGQWTGIAVAFLQDLQAAGYFAMLYSDKNSLLTRFDHAQLAPYAIWVAQWAAANTYPYPYGIWQKSDAGKVSGVSGSVDLDVSLYDYAAIIKKAGLNHL